MRAITDPHPIGQLVVVSIAVIEKSAMFDQQPASVFRRCIAAVPASGRLPGGLADQVDCRRDLPAFLGLRESGVIDPAIAVAADVPVTRSDRCRGGRVRLERPGAAKDRHRQPKTGEDPVEAPKPDPGAVLEHAFGAEVPAGYPKSAPTISVSPPRKCRHHWDRRAPILP